VTLEKDWEAAEAAVDDAAALQPQPRRGSTVFIFEIILKFCICIAIPRVVQIAQIICTVRQT
jgi:hypothetical protein